MIHLQRGSCVPSLTLFQLRVHNKIFQTVLGGVGDSGTHERGYSSDRSGTRLDHVSLSVPTFMVWGANTGVGKTLISAALARDASLKKVACISWPPCTPMYIA